uniref:Uncharacterized protein n=1 Tax=Ornithorhynchus anatinus TaxID=9258 RepID=A0A6I8N0M1_ORNAN
MSQLPFILSGIFIELLLGRLSLARFLVQRGAEVRTADGSQWTALHRASAAGHGQLAAFLLQRGLPDGHGRTPLHRAAAAGHLPVVRTLLGRGAAVDPRDGLGLTPLHRAALGGHAQVAGLLLDRGAQPDAAAGPLRQTPLHLAADS